MSLLSGILDGLKNQAEAGLINGFKTGLNYVKEAEELGVWAFETGNQEAQADAVAISKQWLSETFAEAGGFLPQVVTALEHIVEGKSPGIDPWATSRQMTRDARAKWAAAAGWATG